jgi:hypothetical protein
MFAGPIWLDKIQPQSAFFDSAFEPVNLLKPFPTRIPLRSSVRLIAVKSVE